MSELQRIAALYVPVLLTSDQILDLPDGTDQLAMAFMGLAGETREKRRRVCSNTPTAPSISLSCLT